MVLPFLNITCCGTFYKCGETEERARAARSTGVASEVGEAASSLHMVGA